MNFSELVTSSVLARSLALLVLALALIAAIVVAAFDFLAGRAVPSEIINILYFGLGLALSITGINFGVVLTPDKKEPATATLPTTGGTSV